MPIKERVSIILLIETALKYLMIIIMGNAFLIKKMKLK